MAGWEGGYQLPRSRVGGYHNLAEDNGRGLLLDFDSSGREIEAVQLKENQVEAKLKYLRQFQAGTGLYRLSFLIRGGIRS
jgi:hypothetical protein